MPDGFHSAPPPRLVLVTGPSGAGRTTAIRALEDFGYEAIDNLPLSLIPRLLSGPDLPHPVVLGIDVRNRDFSVRALLDALDGAGAQATSPMELLYIECRAEVLVRRYSETRRRHPLATGEDPETGIEREIALLDPVRARADVLIDSSELSPRELRAELARLFEPVQDQSMAVSLHSFSYKRGLPRGIDMAFDTRFLRNPHWDAGLRGSDGTDPAVRAHVAADPRYAAFFAKVLDFCDLLLPAYIAEGKTHFAMGFGCTGGRHRSVTLAEELAKALAQRNWQVSIRHRELERLRAEAGT